MNEALFFFVLVAGAGAVAGLLSGLIGVGGGVVNVPVLYYIFVSLGYSLDEALHVAIGTSLATIIITQGRSALGHRKRGSFSDFVWRRWSLPIIVGALLGGALAGIVEGKWLAFIFSGGIFFIALILIYRTIKAAALPEAPPAAPPETPRFALSSPALYPLAFLSGLFSAITGIGGGTFNVSALVLLFRVSMREAIGTSSALGVLIGVCGTLTLILSGWGKTTMEHTIGYVNLPAAALIVVVSILTAPLGVALSHRTPQRQLQFFFALMLIFAAVNMFVEGWQA